jgi:hypothetical protein
MSSSLPTLLNPLAIAYVRRVLGHRFDLCYVKFDIQQPTLAFTFCKNRSISPFSMYGIVSFRLSGLTMDHRNEPCEKIHTWLRIMGSVTMMAFTHV